MTALIISALFFASGIPQAIKMIKTKSAKDISLSMYLITILAVALSIGAALNPYNQTLLISNSVSLVILSINLFLIIKYK